MSNEADDDDNLETLLDESAQGFVDSTQSTETAAMRRKRRRERLQALKKANPNGNDNDHPPSKKKAHQSSVAPVSASSVSSPPVHNTPTGTKLSLTTQHAQPPPSAVATAQPASDDDDFDMFSSSPVQPSATTNTKQQTKPLAASQQQQQQQQQHLRGHQQQDWDDAEGYYKAVIGEIIVFNDNSNRFRIAGLIGKGVFSTVLKCNRLSDEESTDSDPTIPNTVAMKLIRHNETMEKAALLELELLQKLRGSPGIVNLLMPLTNHNLLEHRGHLILVFPFFDYNLRDVLTKFGKGVGISLPAVRSYFGQLLAALTHCQKHKIIHADLKPDNILVNSDYSRVEIADFGSARYDNDPDLNQPTPYLVSRYYRAPEIILGLSKKSYAMDLWSVAVTVAELYLGNVLFRGNSNNDMLYVFQQCLGPFSNRVIRQHLIVTRTKSTVPSHFVQQASNYYFTQQTVDKISGVAVSKNLSLLEAHNHNNHFPNATPLQSKLWQAGTDDDKKMVRQFTDLLQQTLHLDPTKRLAVRDALRHAFFQTKTASKQGAA